MTREPVYGRRAVREALRGKREVLELWATGRAVKAEGWLREVERPRVRVRRQLQAQRSPARARERHAAEPRRTRGADVHRHN